MAKKIAKIKLKLSVHCGGGKLRRTKYRIGEEEDELGAFPAIAVAIANHIAAMPCPLFARTVGWTGGKTRSKARASCR